MQGRHIEAPCFRHIVNDKVPGGNLIVHRTFNDVFGDFQEFGGLCNELRTRKKAMPGVPGYFV